MERWKGKEAPYGVERRGSISNTKNVMEQRGGGAVVGALQPVNSERRSTTSEREGIRNVRTAVATVLGFTLGMM